MRIKIAVLLTDTDYENHLREFFVNQYIDQLEMYFCNSLTNAVSAINDMGLDMLILSEDIALTDKQITQQCAVEYLTNRQGTDRINGFPAIYKYQRMSQIFDKLQEQFNEFSLARQSAIQQEVLPEHMEQEIEDTYEKVFENEISLEELEVDFSKMFEEKKKTQYSLVTATADGVGATTVAVAYAEYLAKSGVKTLLINLDKNNSDQNIFQTILLQNNESNVPGKYRQMIKACDSGLHILSIHNLNVEDSNLIKQIEAESDYEQIVMDVPYSDSYVFTEYMDKSNGIFWIDNGSELSGLRLKEIESKLPDIIVEKSKLVFNRYSNDSGKIDNGRIPVVAGFPVYKESSTNLIIEKMDNMTRPFSFF